jgi:Tfp pilus assembly protein PilE
MPTTLQRGFTYIEVLLSVTLLVVLLVPAMEALQSGVANSQGAAVLARESSLREKMEMVLAKPFASLYAETYAPGGNTTTSVSASLSDPVGATGRRNVVLYRYDASAATLSAADTGLVLVQVYYEADGRASALTTLVGRWW